MEQTVEVQEGAVEPECANAINQFMESGEGRKYLDGIRYFLKGSTIVGVEFYPHGTGITTHLLLTDGEYFEFRDEELSLETLREQFAPAFACATNKAKE